VFERAKRFTIVGASLAFLLWFTGFMVGGEWFAMWESKLWNGQEAAFRFYMTVLAVLLFVNQPDRDLNSPLRDQNMPRPRMPSVGSMPARTRRPISSRKVSEVPPPRVP